MLNQLVPLAANIAMSSLADEHKLIDDNVIMGSIEVCLNKDKLKALGIKRVLSITDRPLKKSEKERGVHYKWVPISDRMTLAHLMFQFGHCANYIMEAQKYDENILIHGLPNHLVSGVIVAAFLMKKQSITSEDAAKTMALNPKICLQMHPRFRQYLDIWKGSGYQLNSRDTNLRRVLLQEAVQRIEALILSDENLDFPFLKTICDYVLKFEQTVKFVRYCESNPTPAIRSYCCHECNNPLFTEDQVIENPIRTERPVSCQSVYAEPQMWSVRQTVAKGLKFYTKWSLMSGDIECLECGIKIGEYDWCRSRVCECILHKGLRFFLIYEFRRTSMTL